MHKITQIFYIS